jgi:hypothetical protein
MEKEPQSVELLIREPIEEAKVPSMFNDMKSKLQGFLQTKVTKVSDDPKKEFVFNKMIGKVYKNIDTDDNKKEDKQEVK